MLHWFRVQASRIAATLLMAGVALGGALASQHPDDCHDVACATIVAHDASAHHVGPPPSDADVHPFHCLVCHWARSFRPRTEARILSAPAAQAGDCVHVEFFTASSAAPVAQPPLRSPPASPVPA